ncbi:MAG: hypothetical protein NTV86_13990 [Planctomycetota bacterium]|nr:hypothetical protein [Planctomycetota bacterium]
MIESGELGSDQETFGLFILDDRGELQASLEQLPERRQAMAQAARHLERCPGCVALVVRVRRGRWRECSVYTVGQCSPVASISPPRRRRHGVMDVHTPMGVMARPAMASV